VDRKRGIEVRGNSIRLAFTYQGRRCRETLKIPPTPANIKYAERLRQTILHEIEVGRFDYTKHFPNSPRASAHRSESTILVSDALQEAHYSALDVGRLQEHRPQSPDPGVRDTETVPANDYRDQELDRATRLQRQAHQQPPDPAT
jgi:hypothetical protein